MNRWFTKTVPTDRADYRYYLWLRRIWGRTNEPTARSLCPYFHTLLWLSILSVICSPLYPFGWFFMKGFRLACKIENPLTERFLNYMDRKTEWLTRLDDAPDNFATSPMWTALEYTILGILALIIVIASIGVAATILGITGLGIWNIVDVAVWIFNSIAWTFTQVFLGFYWAGFAFHAIYAEAIWIFTNGPLWTTILSWTVWIAAWLLIFGVGSIALCVACMGLAKTSIAKRFGSFISNKLNGYSEAQKARRARVDKAAKKLPKWTCDFCEYDRNQSNHKCCNQCGAPREKTNAANNDSWIINLIGAIVDFCIKTKNGGLNFFGMTWAYIVALKKGVCPLLEFVDPEVIQAKAKEAAKARMDRENEKCGN